MNATLLLLCCVAVSFEQNCFEKKDHCSAVEKRHGMDHITIHPTFLLTHSLTVH